MCGTKRSNFVLMVALAVFATCDLRPTDAADSILGASNAAPSSQPVKNYGAVQAATHYEPLHQQSAQPLASGGLKITPPGETSKDVKQAGPLGAIGTVVGSLVVVLGLFLGIAWVMRRGLPQSAGRLPNSVVETLGQTALAGRRQMHVLRFGEKLLLVCVSQSGVDTLSEIDDAAEVDRLTKLCQKAKPTAVAGTFDQVFGRLMRSTPAEQTAASGGLAAMALRKKSAMAGESNV